MTAGVASAEITFSGKGEAGVYRTAPTAAVKAVAGVTVTETGAYNNTTAHTADDGTQTMGFVNGVLTTTAMTGTSDGAPDADAIAAQTAAVSAAQALVDAKKLVLDAAAVNTTANDAGENDTAASRIARQTELARLEADLALNKAILAAMTGSKEVAKGATPKLKAYSGYDLDIAASGASDNGMTFAMAFDMGAGHIADQDDDRAMDAQAAAVDTSALTIGYAGYTVAIGDEKVDDLYDADGWNADVSISGSLGDLTFSLATDMDEDVKEVKASSVYTEGTVGSKASTFVETAATAAVYNPTSYAIGYTMGNIAFSMAGTEHDAFGNAAAKMSLSYTVSDATTVKLESDNLGTYKDIAKVSLTQKLSDAMTITASIKDDKDHALNTNKNKAQSSDISIAYTAGALGATLATDEGSNWWVNAQYDLGGGAQAFTTFDHTEFLVAGVNFKF